MKKIFTILVLMTIGILLTASVFAQSHEKISYQAIIRNSSNTLVTNTPIGIQINILQGSSTGTVVYTETQTPTTNANGLASIEIGRDAGFSAINWANGPYFIETKTDIAGGTNYTITETNQLLSIPYALHAKTTETVMEGIAETDPVFNAWDKDYEDLINRPEAADGSETKVTAGSGITLGGAGTTASPYIVSLPPPVILPPLAIGDSYKGGIIFWIDGTGEHGLIAATTDQSTGVKWNNGIDRNTGASGDGLYAGSMNTFLIVATQITDNQTGDFAAKVCADYSVTVDGVTYSDWYLPSDYELYLLYQQENAVGGLYGNTYWSSTEVDYQRVMAQNFGARHLYSEKYFTYNVRAIRAF